MHSAPTAAFSDPRARRPTARRTVWLVRVLVIALCSGGCLWALQAFAGRPPEDVVEKYFAALVDRDADAALALIDDRPREETLLGDDTLKHPDYTPPGNLYVERVPVFPVTKKSPVVVRATYLIGPQRHELDLALVHKAFGWRISIGWADLPANTRTVSPLIVAGTVVPKRDRSTVPAFPGAYVVRLAEQPLFEASPVTVYAGRANGGNGLELRLRGPHQDELERQVREYLDTCAGQPDFTPHHCPFGRASGGQDPPTLSRKVVHYPSLLMRAENDGTISVVGQTRGRAEVTTRTSTGSTRLVREEPYEVSGHLVILEDGKFTFTHT